MFRSPSPSKPLIILSIKTVVHSLDHPPSRLRGCFHARTSPWAPCTLHRPRVLDSPFAHARFWNRLVSFHFFFFFFWRCSFFRFLMFFLRSRSTGALWDFGPSLRLHGTRSPWLHHNSSRSIRTISAATRCTGAPGYT